MRMLDARRYSESAESGQVTSLETIGDSVSASQFGFNQKPFRLRDLTHDREIVTVPMPVELIGDMTPQNSQLDDKSVQLSFCGAPLGAPADAAPLILDMPNPGLRPAGWSTGRQTG
jgi:hypothetical protein